MSKKHVKFDLSSDDEESKFNGNDEELDPMNTSFESTGSKAGRPRLELKWTRVIRVK